MEKGTYMKNKKVLVTGGAGFIGSHIVDELLLLGYEVTVLDNFVNGKIKNIYGKGVKLYVGDIRNSLPNKIMKNVDYIIHQGALINVLESMYNPTEYCDVNVTGTLNILEQARKYNVKRVVLASSSAVENISSPYGLTKSLCEQYAKLYHKIYGLETICLRYFNVYGERQSITGEGTVIPNFITKLLKKEQPIICGTGKQTRDFIYVKDVAKANILALNSPFPLNPVYSIGTGNKTSIISLYKEIKGLLGINIDPVYNKARKGDILDSVAFPNREKAELEWTSKVKLLEGLKRTIKWYKNI